MNIVSLDEHRDSPVDPYERTRNGQKELRELAEAALGLPYLYDGEYRMDILNDDIDINSAWSTFCEEGNINDNYEEFDKKIRD